jgi:hypothetical protein
MASVVLEVGWQVRGTAHGNTDPVLAIGERAVEVRPAVPDLIPR